MRLEDYPTEPRFNATVLSTERITDEGADAEVRELVLEVDRDEFNYEIGQSVGVLVEGPKEFGGSLRQRLYTVADTPSGRGDAKPQIRLVVRRCDYIDDYSGEQYAGVNSNYICDRKPYSGGTLIQLDRWFPDGHCGMCKVLPVFSRDSASQYCLRRGLEHPGMEIVSGCDVEQLSGEAGAFTLSLSVRSTGIKRDPCTGCGKCAESCPVEADNAFNAGLEKRKAR